MFNFVDFLIKLKNSLKLSFVNLRVVKIGDNIWYMFELINDDNNNTNNKLQWNKGNCCCFTFDFNVI